MRLQTSITSLCAIAFMFNCQSMAQPTEPEPQTATSTRPDTSTSGGNVRDGGSDDIGPRPQTQIAEMPLDPEAPLPKQALAPTKAAGRPVYYAASFCLGGGKLVSETTRYEEDNYEEAKIGPPANTWAIRIYHDVNGNGTLEQSEYGGDSVRYYTDKDGHWTTCPPFEERTRYEDFRPVLPRWRNIIVAEERQIGWREIYPVGSTESLIPDDLTPPIPSNAITMGPILHPQLNMRREKLAPNGYAIKMAVLKGVARRLERDQRRALSIDLLQDLSFENEKINDDPPKPRSPLCFGGRKETHWSRTWVNGSLVITTNSQGYSSGWGIYVYTDDNGNGVLDQDEYRNGPEKYQTGYGWGCLGPNPQPASIMAKITSADQVIVVEERRPGWFQTSPVGYSRSFLPPRLTQKLGFGLIWSDRVVLNNLVLEQNNQGQVLDPAPFGYVIKTADLLEKVRTTTLSDYEYKMLSRYLRDRIGFGNASYTIIIEPRTVGGFKTEATFPGNGLKGFTIHAYVDSDGNGMLSRNEYLQGPEDTAVTDQNGWYEFDLSTTDAFIIVEEKQFGYGQWSPTTNVLEQPPLKLEPNIYGQSIRLEPNGYSLPAANNPPAAPLNFANQRVAQPPAAPPCKTCVPEFCPAPEEIRNNTLDPRWGLGRRPRPPRRDRAVSPYDYRYENYRFKEAWMETVRDHIDLFTATEVTFFDTIASPDPLPDRAEVQCHYSTTLDDGSGGKLMVTVEPNPVTDKSYIVESLQIVSDPPWSKYYDNRRFNIYECDHRHDSCAF